MFLELLDLQQIQSMIAAKNLAYLAEIKLFDVINSTNTYLLEQAKQDAPSGLVCLAEEQTSGRGRLGKSWYSPRGANIYCSLLWRFENTLQNISGLSIAIGVMIVNALRQYGIQAKWQLKWPNDVLVENRKLAGILLERSGQSVVIGIGLNLDITSANEKNWIDIRELTGSLPARNILLGFLLNELLEKIPVYAQQGLLPFLAEWQHYDVLFNKKITVMTPEKNIVGVMRGINETGELLLENETGILNFSYGEVSIV